jgi:hypothetical protein
MSAVEVSAYFLGRHSAIICPVRAFDCWSVTNPRERLEKLPKLRRKVRRKAGTQAVSNVE